MRQIKKALLSITKPLGLLGLYHFLFAWGADTFYGHPSRGMVVVGITGTKGKTTVIELLNAIFQEAGQKVALTSSIRFQVGERSWINDTGNTMPGRGYIQKLLKQGADAGCGYALIEVVSEGIAQNRHRFIDFDVAVFIGLHPEHIESHGSLENYREAKLKFFRDVARTSRKESKRFVVNKNSEHSRYFTDAVDGENVISYDMYTGPINLAGDFNKSNAAAARAVARVLGISDGVIESALSSFIGVPGRMEFIRTEPFAAVVDYAHTPDSLEAVYKAVRSEIKGRLICVLGSAGGGRDKWKRPKLGEIASARCGEIILTDEDPFDEDPKMILGDIRAGVTLGAEHVYEILDRKSAIKKAVSLAKRGDAVVVTGKGSEPYIRVAGGHRIPWSDADVLHGALAENK